MATLDSILNFLIPVGIITFLFVIVFNKFKDPLTSFYSWVKERLAGGTTTVKERTSEIGQQIVYR